MTLEGAEAHPRAPSSRFDWTRIHLVYLALAAFDLLAILTGLGLSEWSNSQHARTVDKVNQTTFLREHIRELQGHAIKLSGTAQLLFASGDVERAQLELGYLKSGYGLLFSTAAFDRKLSALLPAKGGSAEDITGDGMMQHLTYATNEDISNFIAAKEGIEQQIAAMYEDAAAFASALATGNAAAAVESRMRFEKSFQTNMQFSAEMAAKLDNNLQSAVRDSADAFAFASLLQYAVGGAILLMIVAACAYAHYVGKLLRKKYAELQASKDEAEASGTRLAQANTEVTGLNHQLEENLQLLKRQQDDLVRKGRMEQLGQLTATVAHELRNPLGGMKTSAFLLERKLQSLGLTSEPSIQRINNGVNRCDKIITQLLDYSRTQQVSTEPVALDAWLENVVQEEVKKLAPTLSVTAGLGLGEAVVDFDTARLQRAVINLIANASEALMSVKDEDWPPGQAREIRLRTFAAYGFATICVSDNGPGMEANILKRVREPLFTTKSFGTGLGVPAVEQIAILHGGSLDIESTPGKGATFTLRLPLQSQQKAA